jgi:hypothetical protein
MKMRSPILHRLRFKRAVAYNGLAALFVFVAGVVFQVAAQAPPVGGAVAGGGGGEPDPFGAGGKPATGAKTEAAVDLTKTEPFPIQVLRESNPTSPRELMRAAQAVLQFGRPDECKQYLAKLLASKPTDESLAPLTSSFGDFLFQLSRRKELQPEGRQAADLVFGAAQRTAQNPDRINALIAQLSAPSPGERQEAVDKLAASGRNIVTPMLRVLTDATREREHPHVRTALAQLSAVTELPLIGALDGAGESLKAQIIAVLGRMGSGRAAVHLVRPALDTHAPAQVRDVAVVALQKVVGAMPDRYEARRYLSNEATRLLHGELPYEADQDDNIELWSWDEAKREVSARKLPKADAAVFLAARVANDLYALNADDSAAQRLMLLTNLEWTKVVGGLDQPLPIGAGTSSSIAMQSGPRVMSQVLADAMKQERVPASIAAVEVLASLGDASVLETRSGAASPLAEAITFPDRRVRLAAALAAVKLAPGASFPGAGRVTQTLGWFIGASGGSYVLVGHPRGEDAQTIVGFINGLGYEGQAAYSGRTFVAEATANPDFEFILVSDAIDSPPVKEIAQWLRRDFRTARVPLGIMARGEHLAALRDAFSDDRFTLVFPGLHSTAVAAVEVEKLKVLGGRNLVGRDERIAQARAALTALATLARDENSFATYELLRQEPVVVGALYNPALAADAANVLALYGTPKAQAVLVDFASQNTRFLSDRQAAAAGFAVAVKARGLRLTQQQIATQYDRYNASQRLDRPAQELLGSILDTIEAPATARGDLSKRE